MEVQNNTVLYDVITGSRAYNLVVPDSDYDHRRVVTPNTLDYFFGLNSFDVGNAITTKMEDNTDYSLRNFVKLLVSCNTIMLEMIYAPSENSDGEPLQKFVHPLFDKYFLKNKDKFLTKKIYKAILNYANAEYGRSMGTVTRNLGSDRKADIVKYGYSIKNASHCIRLLNSGIVSLQTGKFPVWITGPIRDFVYDLKLAKVSKEAYIDKYIVMMSMLEEAYKASTLPEEPDYIFFNQILTYFYQDFFRGLHLI